MPIEVVPEFNTPYFLICYDERGRETQESTGEFASDEAIKSLQDASVTDVFIMSHGWRGDFPGARGQYNKWITAMMSARDDIALMEQKRPGFRPLIIGLHWPSEPYGDEHTSRVMARASAGADAIEELVNDAAGKTVDTPQARAALTTIMTAALDDPNPPTLPDDVKSAYDVLNRETGMGESGPGAAPGHDRDSFNPDRVTRQRPRIAKMFGDFVDSVRLPLRLLSFWQMKDRARLFGETGAFQLLSKLMRSAGSRDVKFHVMGHSFGSIVASAAITGPAGSRLPAQIDSLALIQGALSLWSYCSDIPCERGKPGYFHKLFGESRVRGPIITTNSTYDYAVGRWYPWAAGSERPGRVCTGARDARSFFGIHEIRRGRKVWT